MFEQMIEEIAYFAEFLLEAMIKTIRRYISYIRMPKKKPSMWFKNATSMHIGKDGDELYSPLKLFFTMDDVVFVWFDENLIYFNSTGHLMVLTEYLKETKKDDFYGSPLYKHKLFLYSRKAYSSIADKYEQWKDEEAERYLFKDQ